MDVMGGEVEAATKHWRKTQMMAEQRSESNRREKKRTAEADSNNNPSKVKAFLSHYDIEVEHWGEDNESVIPTVYKVSLFQKFYAWLCRKRVAVSSRVDHISRFNKFLWVVTKGNGVTASE